MRITGGQARGIPLKVPSVTKIRPATDLCRQACFSSLGDRVSGARILDLFSGTGAYGIEALSRNAKSCVFVDNNYQAVQCIKHNIRSLKKSLQVESLSVDIFQQDALKWLKNSIQEFDFIFIDPPYFFYSQEKLFLYKIFDNFSRKALQATFIIEGPSELSTLVHPSIRCEKVLGKGKKSPRIWILEQLA